MVVQGEQEKKNLINKYIAIKELGDNYKPQDIMGNMKKAKLELCAHGLIDKIGLNLVEQTQKKLIGDKKQFNEKIGALK